ncbi:MAG: helix-turn-helix transcriptional regulator [Nocardioides sp.]|jgi:DNA-binding transcriptional regulator YiaG
MSTFINELWWDGQRRRRKHAAQARGDTPSHVVLTPDDLPGMVRRVRRLLSVSQRELALLLGVSQSAVAKWETGRNVIAGERLVDLLHMAGLVLVPQTESGAPAPPMSFDAERDRAWRRFPAYADVIAHRTWDMEDPCASTNMNKELRWGVPRPEFSRVRPPPGDPWRASDHQPTRAELAAELSPRLQERYEIGRAYRAKMLPIWARTGELEWLVANQVRWR